MATTTLIIQTVENLSRAADKMASSVYSFLFLAALLISTRSLVVPDQSWAYVEVRPDAHMFWWLYGCTSCSQRMEEAPLVMWLQGGPGGSSTGFGNFMEIGPLDVDLQPRDTTWVQAASILFVDNPVGTGYSYVTDDSAYTTDVSEIAADLVTLFSSFLEKWPVFEKVPFYVFCESYGGKMTAAFAQALMQAVASGTVHTDFRGVALGDSWISPIDSVKTWGPYLYSTSLLNQRQLQQVQAVADQTQQALNDGKFAEATTLWSEAEDLIEKLTDNVDFYNILIHNGGDEMSSLTSGWSRFQRRHLGRMYQESLSELMNGKIKQQLQIIPENVTWGGQAGKVFDKQRVDFMKDVVSTVDDLLKSGLNVTIYNGQLDLIVDTPGTLDWVHNLTWPGLSNFMNATKRPLYPPSGEVSHSTGAFLQSYSNLSFYWILKAGHMVPADAGETALLMLKMVIGVN